MTAVQWFSDKIKGMDTAVSIYRFKELLDQAKEMEKKEQKKIGIIIAIFAEELGDKKCIELLNKAEQYYNETFKSE
jgi:hypothetical protein